VVHAVVCTEPCVVLHFPPDMIEDVLLLSEGLSSRRSGPREAENSFAFWPS
jgi:hypothetical protein